MFVFTKFGYEIFVAFRPSLFGFSCPVAGDCEWKDKR